MRSSDDDSRVVNSSGLLLPLAGTKLAKGARLAGPSRQGMKLEDVEWCLSCR